MPWRGVHQEHGPLAGGQRAAHLVAEVHVAGGVDQVEDVAVVVDPDVLGLDGDAPLPLDVHRIEVLLAHEPGIDRPGDLEDAVREGRLAVVDVADDGEVADAPDRDGSTGSGGGRHGPSIVPAQARLPGRLARTTWTAWRREVPPAGRQAPPATVVPRAGGLAASPPTPFEQAPRIVTWPISRARSSGTARTRSAGCATSRCGPRLRTRTKNAVAAAETGAEDSAEPLRLAVKRIDKAAAQGVIHKNTAANHKSRLMRRVHALEAAE